MKNYDKRNFHINYVPQHITHNWAGKLVKVSIPSKLPPFVLNIHRDRKGRVIK